MGFKGESPGVLHVLHDLHGKKLFWAGLFPFVLSLSALLSCGPSPSPARTDIVIALANSPVTMDPGVALDEASQKIQQLLFSSLLKIDDSLRVVPDLATRFEAPDPLTYVAEIPPGVRFHDGREMTAEDVAYTFRRFLDPRYVSGRKGAYRGLRAVDVVSRYSVAFRLTQPSVSFPINLVMSLVPAGAGPEMARAPVGSGPYRLAEFVPDDHVTLVPFASAYGGAPANGGVTFKVVPDETMRGLELRKGSVDMVVNDLSPDLVAGLRSEPHLQIATAPGTDYAYLGFNLRDPVLRDLRVRQAIGYAIDAASIVRYLRQGLAQSATGVLPPMSWAYAADVFRFTHDPAKARALLDEAGYPDAGGAHPAPRLHLSLKTSTNEAYRLQAAVIQQNLAEVGIALDVRSYEFSTLMADVLKGNVQMYTLQWVGVTDPDMLRRTFHSGQVPPGGFNRGYYRNAEVDRLIDEATAAVSEAERARLYQAAQRLIAADVPYVSLWDKTNVIVASADLSGIDITPTADFSFLTHVSHGRK
jgi:peptide/nickel transport system substrate-binding protein